MRLFSRPGRKPSASMTPLRYATAGAASKITGRVEITVEREWIEAVVRPRKTPRRFHQTTTH